MTPAWYIAEESQIQCDFQQQVNFLATLLLQEIFQSVSPYYVHPLYQ